MTEKPPMEKQERSFLTVGQTLTIGETIYKIEKVAFASEIGKDFGMKIPRLVPVYYLDGISRISKGAYHPEHDIVVIFTNTDRETMQHELTHVIEFHQEKSPELINLYQHALKKITEDSFEGPFATFNFTKNIHEFIADGRTKPPFIAALKKEGLYDEFVKATADLFEE